MGRRQPAASARCSHDRGSPETLEHRTELVASGLEGFTFSTSGHDGGLRPSSTTLSEGKARGLTVDLRLRTGRVPDYDAILHAGEVKHPPGAGQLEDRVIKPDLYDPKINRTYADGRALRVGSTLPEPRSPRTSPALSGRNALRA